MLQDCILDLRIGANLYTFRNILDGNKLLSICADIQGAVFIITAMIIIVASYLRWVISCIYVNWSNMEIYKEKHYEIFLHPEKSSRTRSKFVTHWNGWCQENKHVFYIRKNLFFCLTIFRKCYKKFILMELIPKETSLEILPFSFNELRISLKFLIKVVIFQNSIEKKLFRRFFSLLTQERFNVLKFDFITLSNLSSSLWENHKSNPIQSNIIKY